MKDINDLKSKIATLTDEAEAITNKEDFTDEDIKSFDSKTAEIKALNERVAVLEKMKALKAEKAETAPAIVHTVGQKADVTDPLKAAARNVIFKAWEADPTLGHRGAVERFVKEFGREAFGTEINKDGPITVGSVNFQAPNYRPELLVPLLNKNIVTADIVKQVQMRDNNLIAPRMITGSSGAFNLENGLIATSDIGTDVIVLAGQYYGSIIPSTKQALAFSGGMLEDIISNEMITRHKLIVESIVLNSTGINNAPLGFKGFTSATQNIKNVDFTTVMAGTDAGAKAQAVIQLFSSAVLEAVATMRNAGDYADKYLVIPEIVHGVLQSQVTITGNYVLSRILEDGFMGVKIVASSNLSTNEDSLVTGATASGDIAPCYLISQDAVWQGNGNFFEFQRFDQGMVGSQNLLQQAGVAYRLIDSIATNLQRDVSLTRIELKGITAPVDNSVTYTAQAASGQVSTATGIGKAKTTGTGTSSGS